MPTPPREPTLTFALRPSGARRLLWGLIGFELLLVLGYAATRAFAQLPWGPLSLLFDLDREATVAAWFSALQLFAIGALLLFLAGRHATPRWFFGFVGLAFVFLSLDEAAAIHEMMGKYVIKAHLSWLNSLNYKGGGVWVVLYLAAGVGFALFGFRRALWLLRRAPRPCAWVALGVLTMLVAIGFEFLSYVYLRGDETSAAYLAEVALEEFCEMAGASLILFGVTGTGLALAGAASQVADTKLPRQADAWA